MSPAPDPVDALTKLSRAALNTQALEAGISDAADESTYPTKRDLATALALASGQTTVTQTTEAAPDVEWFHFTFPAGDGEDAPTRVSVGHSPRVSLASGESYATTDPRVAKRLRRVPELVEVTR